MAVPVTHEVSDTTAGGVPLPSRGADVSEASLATRVAWVSDLVNWSALHPFILDPLFMVICCEAANAFQ